jgi:hypothetical protein
MANAAPKAPTNASACSGRSMGPQHRRNLQQLETGNLLGMEDGGCVRRRYKDLTGRDCPNKGDPQKSELLISQLHIDAFAK